MSHISLELLEGLILSTIPEQGIPIMGEVKKRFERNPVSLLAVQESFRGRKISDDSFQEIVF